MVLRCNLQAAAAASEKKTPEKPPKPAKPPAEEPATAEAAASKKLEVVTREEGRSTRGDAAVYAPHVLLPDGTRYSRSG